MEIEWRVKNGQSPYKFLQRAEWEGVSVHRAQVVAGRMLPHVFEKHELNINISGLLTNEKVGLSGDIVTLLEKERSLCLTTAGQTAAAHWDGPIDNLGIYIDPAFLSRTASESAPNFEFNKY